MSTSTHGKDHRCAINGGEHPADIPCKAGRDAPAADHFRHIIMTTIGSSSSTSGSSSTSSSSSDASKIAALQKSLVALQKSLKEAQTAASKAAGTKEADAAKQQVQLIQQQIQATQQQISQLSQRARAGKAQETGAKQAGSTQGQTSAGADSPRKVRDEEKAARKAAGETVGTSIDDWA
jgi:hypothetical protein